MNKSVTVRQLTNEDVQTFYKVRLESLQDCPKNFQSSYEEEKSAGFKYFEDIFNLNNINNAIFGAFIQNELIGVIGIYQERQLKTAHKCNIWGLYVKANYRNKGVGRLLLEATIKHAKDKIKCLVINLSLETENVAAKSLYESFGFEIWGTETKALCSDQKFYDEFHMSLFL